MALVLGTNCGFVSSSPSADPAGSLSDQIDNIVMAFKCISPAGVTKITELGWYCDNATEAADYEIAVYTHDAAVNRPLNLVGSIYTTAKGTGAGWKKTTVDITITASTTYWISMQLDDTATETHDNGATTTGERAQYKAGTALIDPWGSPSSTWAELHGIYALYTAAAGTNITVNVGDVWKDVASASVNVGDVWKDVTAGFVNVGDVWKTVF